MSLYSEVKSAIQSEAKKLAERHERYHNQLHLNFERNQNRLGRNLNKVVHTPESWQKDRKFNPFYVLSNLDAITRSIVRKIKSESYVPIAPITQTVPKGSGGFRTVQIYQIPDAAISNLFYQKLLAKNKHRFSSFSYAYRHDKNVHFAIQDIAVDLRRYARLFVAEFDFSDFFGSINHEYLNAQLGKNGFLITPLERNVIQAFLPESGSGIPQGTSISLFLANLACWKLDQALESIGLKFARYADDTIIWSDEYGKICRASSAIHDFSNVTGVKINLLKSHGVSLLTKEGLGSEFAKKKTNIDFLGYTIGVEKTSIKESNLRRIKKQISYLIFRNLIQPLKRSHLYSMTIPSGGKDEALLITLSQIRRFLYGNLSESALSKILLGHSEHLNFKGIMNFYPLVDDEDQLRDLDRWLCRSLFHAIKLRSNLLISWDYDRSNQFPFNVPREDFVRVMKEKLIGQQQKRLLTIPSFLKIHQALKLQLLAGGIENTSAGSTNSYHYD
jgi:RNA-directed DNA polymerase